MIVTGALADPKIGPDSTDGWFADLLWEAVVDGLRSKPPSHATATIVRNVNRNLTIEISTTLSFQKEC
jgi:hypothetical protein